MSGDVRIAMNSVDSRKAVSHYLESLSSRDSENYPSTSDDTVAVDDVKHIAKRVEGLSKAMRIVAFNAQYESSTRGERTESFQNFTGEFFRLAQECDRAAREFDKVVKNAAKGQFPRQPVARVEELEDQAGVA